MKNVKVGFLLLMLALGGICFISCDKDGEDENGLGASRPIYEDYSKGLRDLAGTTWSETKNGVVTTLKCNATSCTFTYSNKPSATYTHYLESGNVYFTPSNGSGDVLRGTFTFMRDGKDLLDVFNHPKNTRLHILKKE